MNLIPATNENTSGWTQTSAPRQWNLDSTNDQWLLNTSSTLQTNNTAQSSSTNTNQNSNQQNSLLINQSSNISSNSTQQSTNQSNNTSPIELETQMSNNWSQIVELQTTNPTSSTNNNQLESPKPNTLTDTEIINKCIVNGNLKDEILYSLDWGKIPINQNTPWELPNQPQQSPREIHSINGVIDNSWKYSTSTIGTEIWESNIRKKSIASDLQLNHQLLNEQQKSAQITPNSLNHFGGNWGNDDTTPINANKLMWNGSNSAINNNNNNNNNNWLDNNNDNNNKNGWNDDKINTWNSIKDMNGWNNDSELSNAQMHDNMMDGTALWKRPPGKMNQRWKEDSNDLLIKQTNKPNNLTNQCANFNAQNNNNNNFVSTSPSVIRLPQNLNSLQANKVQNLQLSNWNDSNQNKNQLSNNNNGMQQSNGQNVFWNNSNNNNNINNDPNNAQLNWNKLQSMNQDDWNIKKELILQSQQFKVLVEKGFRKESIENALRNSNMNLRDAIEELRADALKENCNDIDKRKNSGFNHTSSLPPNSSINRNTSQSFNQISQQQTQQPNQIFRNNNNNNNNLNNKPNSNTAMVQDPKRLGNLVQQINLAVNSGHLNAQILNQPLSVNTIQLINQLLAQIRNLQQLQQLQQHAPNMNKNSLGTNSQTADLNVQITVIKQRISNIQNQIRVQQGFYMNSNQQQQQLQQQQQTQQSIPNNADLIANGLPINAVQLQNDFNKLISPDSASDNLIGDLRDLQIGNNNSQSRLSKWQQNAVTNNFDNSNGQSGFSRAPGSINNTANNNWSSNGNNFNNDDNSWNLNDAATAATNANDLKNVLQNQQTTFLTDQVPEFKEFEPGKPWKSAIKSSDDDPHLTPGSVNRSIVSLNNLNNWSSKNTTTVNNNLQQQTTNTWSFNTNGNNVISSNATNWNGGAAVNNNNNNFTNESTSPVENLWQQHSNKSKVTGPPPGLTPSLSPNKSIASSLIIKNITPQVDTPTLKLLCSQHGPLQIFQILNNGIAIVKYKTKEEAIKAQSALNNCQLSNTKIFVDFLAEDSEIQNYLTNQTQLNSVNNVYLNGGQAIINNQVTANLWRNNTQQQQQVQNNDSQWSFNSNNLWNNSIDTNSTMQNLLPGDLLNGETS